MEYTRLGSSGLKVSRITLGCMSFGDADRFPVRPGRLTGRRGTARNGSFGRAAFDIPDDSPGPGMRVSAGGAKLAEVT
jgi:aryl-alcohol dehydrogenase-like predicted oxidoreductase